MALAKSLAIATGLLLAFPASTPAKPVKSDRELELARDYVFAACLIERYRGEPLEKEAQTWASGLVEAGHLPPAAYPALMQLAKRAPSASLEPNGVTIRIAGCQELIHAPGFNSLLRKSLAPFLRQPLRCRTAFPPTQPRTGETPCRK